MSVSRNYDEIIVSRVVPAPDGISYLVPMHPYYWDCLDEMVAVGWTTFDEVMGIAWRGKERNAQNDLRSDLPFTLNVAIDEMHEHYLTRVRGYAND